MDPFVICPYVILVDQREKAPYAFTGIPVGRKGKRKICAIETKTALVKTGDYSIEGYDSRVTVERKSKEDAYSTFGKHRERFEREMVRMQDMEYSAIVIESSWTEFMTLPPPRSKMRPKSLDRSIIAWSQRFPKTHWFWRPTRREGEKLTYRILDRWWIDNIQKPKEEMERRANG